MSRKIGFSRLAISASLAAALMAAGCGTGSSYSLGSGGGIGGGGGSGDGGGGDNGGGGNDGGGNGGGDNGGGDNGGGDNGGGGGGDDGDLGQTTGLAGLLDPVGVVTVGDQTLIGDPNAAEPSPLGVSALSPSTAEGSVATVGLANEDGLLTVGVGQADNPANRPGGPADGLLGVTVGDQTLGAAQPVVGLGVLSPDAPAGAVLGVGVLSNGQPVSISGDLGGTPAGGIVGGVVQGAGDVVSGALGAVGGAGDAGGLNGLANPLGEVTVGQQTVLGESGSGGPLGVGVLSPTAPQGSVASVGVLTGGSLANVSTGTANTPAPAPSGSPDAVLGLNVGGTQVLGGGAQSPAVGLNVLSPTGATGTAVSGNVLSNGQPLAVDAPAQGGVLQGVGDAVGGVVGGLTGAGQSGSGGLLGGLLKGGD